MYVNPFGYLTFDLLPRHSPAEEEQKGVKGEGGGREGEEDVFKRIDVTCDIRHTWVTALPLGETDEVGGSNGFMGRGYIVKNDRLNAANGLSRTAWSLLMNICRP